MVKARDAEKQLVVLDINPIVAGLIDASNYYTIPRTLICSEEYIDTTPTSKTIINVRDVAIQSQPIIPLSFKRAFSIALALVNEMVGQYVQYRMPISSLDTIAIALTENDTLVPDRVQMTLAEDFLCLDSVDSLVIDLQQTISTYILPNTWRQWDVINTTNVIALLGGEDHRIAEWKRQNPQWEYTDENTKLVIDIATLTNYLANVIKSINPQAFGYILPTSLVMDALQRYYPHLNNRHNTQMLYEAVPKFLNMSNDEFYHCYTRQLIKAFMDTHIRVYTDRRSFYKVDVTPSQQLVFTLEPLPTSMKDRYYWDIKQAIENGDWVPEIDRRNLQAYERTQR